MNRSREVVEILLFFLAFFLPGYLAQAAARPIGPVDDAVLMQSIIVGLPQFLLMAYVMGVKGPAVSPEWGFMRVSAGDSLRILVLIAGCFAVIAAGFGLSRLLPPGWSAAALGGYRWGLKEAGQIPLALVFGLTAGYREELFFRSYLLGRLEKLGVPVSIAAAGSTIIFSLGHAYEGLFAVMLTAVLGLVFCAAYLKWRSIHVVAIAHAGYNIAVLCISLFAPDALPAAAAIPVPPLHSLGLHSIT
jgi:membrane protease YdiL (CAAX protease family)